MSGYLRRLAERTLSAAPPVHSTAGRPYASMPSTSEVEILLGEAHPLSPVVREGASAIPPDREPTPFGPHEPPTSHVRPGSEPRQPEPRDITARIDRPSGGKARAGVLPSVSGQEKAGVHPPEHLPAPPVPVEPFQTRVLPRSEVERDEEFVPLVKTARPSDPAVHPVFGRPIDTRPPLGDKPRAYATAPPDPSHRDVDTSAPEANEVHVTIGRIEITAVHAPPPSKPAPIPARKPMSLDEYLAKRNGGQP